MLVEISGRLLDTLLGAQATAWKSDRRISVEELLKQHGLTGDDPDLLLALIEGEILLREDRGELRAAAIQDFVSRFPELEQEIRELSRRSESGLEPGRPRAASRDLPDSIGRYRVERLIGQGSFGLVYLAHDDQLQRAVAIKVPHDSRIAHTGDAAAYLAEARLVANLSHPHIVPVYDVGSAPGFPCYVVSMFIDGNSLSQKLERWRPSHRDAADLVAAIAEALDFAHGQRIIHRDVKPANILLDREGQPYLADFGLALREQQAGELLSQAGTPAYMSPEQIRGEGHLFDNRSDVFSLGVVLYELLAGKRPFAARTPDELQKRICNQEPVPLRQIDDRIPLALEQVCSRALAKRRADRYSSARELADDVRNFLAEPVGSPRADGEGGQQLVGVDGETPAKGGGANDATLSIVPKGLRAFDEHDADFFLELLPGPRDRYGLPDSLRFWKTRIEERDPSRTFSVGLIYGPSGSGKSSLVRAGLLPRLSPDVACVYVAATPADTESRLLSGLCRCGVIDSARRLDLLGALSALRLEGGVSACRKLLIVIDQFEQWLHARANPADLELVDALRQCDGAHVQCLILVRDDFWMGATRFFNELEVNLVQGHNAAVVDLFDADHARRILAAFGRAFGRLPERTAAITREQHGFLDEAVAGLAQNGKVVGAHLALFADMMKDKPWTPTELRRAGGTSGLGETFLDATFSAPSANPRHRLHQATVRSVLAALLPDEVTDIRGHMRSFDELREAAGAKVSAADFLDVIQLLDSEVRLITPTDAEGKDEGGRMKDEESAGVESCSSSFILPTSSFRYYQLTHDYLVQPLRNWLTRKRQETRRGRAELQLAERSRLWQLRQDRRFLPTFLEYLKFRVWTESRRWNNAERGLMRQAGRRHLIRVSAGLVLFAAGCAAALSIREELAGQRAFLSAEHHVEKFRSAETTKVPDLIEQAAAHRPRIEPLLWRAYESPDSESNFKLYTALALLPDDRVVPYLQEQLPRVTAVQFPIVLDKLRLYKYSDTAIHGLKVLALKTGNGASEPFQAACALAAYAPNDAIWETIGPGVVDDLLQLEASGRVTWRATLAPAATFLLPRLHAVYRDPEARVEVRVYAAETLVAFPMDEPRKLFELLADSEQLQFPWIYERIADHHRDEFVAWGSRFLRRGSRKLTHLTWDLEVSGDEQEKVDPEVPGDNPDTRDPPDVERDDREKLGQQLANVAVALLKLEQPEAVWPIFRKSSDNRARSRLIHIVQPLGVNPFQLIAGYDAANDPSIKMALLQALGEYAPGQLRQMDSNAWGALLAALPEAYRTSTTAGLHSHASWLLRKWHRVDGGLAAMGDLQNAVRRLQPDSEILDNYTKFNRRDKDPERRREWFITQQQQAFSILRLRPFRMGSPDSERGRRTDERQQLAGETPRRFAISMREVTRREFGVFLDFLIAQTGDGKLKFEADDFRYMPDDDSPVIAVNWHFAAWYCNWLSKEHGIPREEWCYEPNGPQPLASDEKETAVSVLKKCKDGVQPAADFLKREGFRLPTEEEWEFACRAGTVTSRYYGESPDLLPQYAFFLGTGSSDGERSAPVGQLKPNDFGLFDMLGNVYEWCHDVYDPHRETVPRDDGGVGNVEFRTYKGGGFSSLANYSRAALRARERVGTRNPQFGLRPVRTLPDRPDEQK
jgi:serine/threonine protein kinase/formylglycine-generating enzyme required for sulfatase activity